MKIRTIALVIGPAARSYIERVEQCRTRGVLAVIEELAEDDDDSTAPDPIGITLGQRPDDMLRDWGPYTLRWNSDIDMIALQREVPANPFRGDCRSCEFLGTDEDFDAYVCLDRSVHTVSRLGDRIVRHNDLILVDPSGDAVARESEARDHAGAEQARHLRRFDRARRLANGRGLYQIGF